MLVFGIPDTLGTPNIALREVLMSVKRQLLISTALGLVSMPPSGQAAPPAPQVYSWAGFYIGPHVGYSWGSLDGDTTQTVIIPSTPPGFSVPGGVLYPALARDVDPQGPLGGFQAGYNLQSGAWVYGIEADISWTGQHDSFNFNGNKALFSEDFNFQETLASKLKYVGTVRARIGYAFGDLLPYITGGFAYGDLKMNLNSILTQPGTCTPCLAAFSTSQSQVLLGGAVGAGLEHGFAQHWSLRAEYLFVDLGHKTFFPGVPGGGSFGLTDNIFRVGINFKP